MATVIGAGSASTADQRPISLLARSATLLIGLALPVLVIGRATMQAELILALLLTVVVTVTEEGISRPLARGRAVVGTAVGWGVLLTLIAWLFSVGHSLDPWRSFKSWMGAVVYVAGAVGFYVFLCADERRARAALQVLLAAGGLALLAALAGLDVNGAEITARLRGGGGDGGGGGEGAYLFRWGYPHKIMASAALCMLPVVLWAGLRLGGIWRWVGLADALACLALIPMVGSRSALAGLAVMVAVACGVLAWRHRRWLPWYTLALIGAIGGIVYWLAGRPLTAEGAPLGVPAWLIDTHRQYIWGFAFSKGWESLWVGWGINAIDRIPGSQEIIPEVGSTYIPSHPHNWLLEVFAETGLVGIVPIVATLVVLLVKLVRDVLHQGSGWSVARLGLMIGFWSAALFNFSFWAVWWQLTFLVLFAILSAGERIRPAEARHE